MAPQTLQLCKMVSGWLLWRQTILRNLLGFTGDILLISDSSLWYSNATDMSTSAIDVASLGSPWQMLHQVCCCVLWQAVSRAHGVPSAKDHSSLS
jgi:hypothetical protein